MNKVLAIGFGVLAAVGAGLWMTARIAEDGPSPERIAAGRTLYAENCASCHGADLEGQPDWRSPGLNGRLPAPPHDETGHTWHHPDALLMRIVREGIAAVVGNGYESDMPGYGDILSDDEIASILDYIKSTWPDRIREAQARASSGG